MAPREVWSEKAHYQALAKTSKRHGILAAGVTAVLGIFSAEIIDVTGPSLVSKIGAGALGLATLGASIETILLMSDAQAENARANNDHDLAQS